MDTFACSACCYLINCLNLMRENAYVVASRGVSSRGLHLSFKVIDYFEEGSKEHDIFRYGPDNILKPV